MDLHYDPKRNEKPRCRIYAIINTLSEPFSGDLLADDQGGMGENNVSIKVIRLLVCTVGVIGNAMVIFVILVLKEYKKTLTNWYVLQLAFADSLFLLTLPFKVAEDEYGEWIFSGGLCKLKEAILFLNYYSSILFLMVMSIDRYIAVCHGLSPRLRKLREKRSAYIITAVVWAVSLLLCAPILAYSDKAGLDPNCICRFDFPTKHNSSNEGDLSQNEEKCSRNTDLTFEDSGEYYQSGSEEDYQLRSEIYAGDWMTMFFNHSASGPVYEHGCSYAQHGAGWSAFVSFNFIVMFAIPFLIMSVCYCLIAFRLKQSRIRRSSVTNESNMMVSTATRTSGKTERKRTKSAASAKAERNRIRVTVTCLILVVLFLICWLPFHAVHLAKMNGIPGRSINFCAKLSSVSTVIAYLNSALNPYIYNFIGTKFGKRLRSAARSVRTSVKKRTSSLSSARGTVQYQPRKQSGAGISTNSATTVMTRIYRRKSEMELSSHCEDETQGRETLLQT